MVFEKIAAAPVAGAASSNSKVLASSATARVARRSSVVEGASGAGANVDVYAHASDNASAHAQVDVGADASASASARQEGGERTKRRGAALRVTSPLARV